MSVVDYVAMKSTFLSGIGVFSADIVTYRSQCLQTGVFSSKVR